MKLTNLLLIILAVLLVNCSKNKKEIDYIILSGEINGLNIDSLAITDKDFNTIKIIHLSKELTFRDTLIISKGYYHISDFKTSSKLLFLKPSYNLDANIVSNKNDYSISFKGIGSNENNYLQEKETYNKSFKKYKKYMSLSEDKLLKYSDSMNNAKMNFLNLDRNLESDFKDYENFSIKSDKSYFLYNYSRDISDFKGDKDYKVSIDFPKPFAGYNVSDENMMIHPSYLNLVLTTIENKYKIPNVYNEINLDLLSKLDKEISSETIKDEVVNAYVKEAIYNTKELDSVYAKFMSIVKNETYRNEIQNKYDNLKKMSKGITSPTFELYDVNNQLVTLESLKGKLVYIDIWGTWCYPCVQEIPALKKIEKEFRGSNIHFVSISIRDKKENLISFINENNLAGIQLFAPKLDILFFEFYQLKTVPRFILIDKEGKILDANAYKPSNPRLNELIRKYL